MTILHSSNPIIHTMTTFHLRIIKPEKIVYENDIVSLSFPTTLGQTTVLAQHEPMVMQAVVGEVVVIMADGKKEHLALAGGVVEVKHDEVLVLASHAEHALEIDIQAAKEARDRVAIELEKLPKEHPSYEALLSKLHREDNLIKLSKKHRR